MRTLWAPKLTSGHIVIGAKPTCARWLNSYSHSPGLRFFKSRSTTFVLRAAAASAWAISLAEYTRRRCPSASPVSAAV